MRTRNVGFLLSATMLFAISFCLLSDAYALPFNDDMVDNQKRTGSIMRALPHDSVPVGFEAPFPATKNEAMAMVNTVKADLVSIKSGERLFRVNCYPCHGDIAKTPYSPGPASVNSKGALPGIDISSSYYQEKTDGYFFATIHYGGLAMMPGLGWKLSDVEHWDIVNYIRTVQKAKALPQPAQ